jgi:hypothetical protein
MEWEVGIALGMIALLIFRLSFGFKGRIALIERKLDWLLRHSGLDPHGLPLSERVKQLAGDPARKIEAIKVYREETGAGLAEAVQAVEDFIKSK